MKTFESDLMHDDLAIEATKEEELSLLDSLNSIANKAFALGDKMKEIKRKEQGR